MTRILFVAAVAGFASSIAGHAHAETITPAPDRYELKAVEGGFLRLDRESGLTAVCKPSGEGYACLPAQEGKSAEAAMVASLEKRVAELETKVKALSGETPGAKAATPADPTLQLPSDAQVDRVATFLERALKRLKKIAAEAQKDGDQPL